MKRIIAICLLVVIASSFAGCCLTHELEVVSQEAASCENAGVAVYKCANCDYEETKTTQRKEGGKTTVTVEKFNKYSPPDTVAAHLLLKNYDSNWHNDDAETIAQKRKQLEQNDRRIDNAEF